MSIKQVTAWQISTGACFPTKAEAVHEEMVLLLREQAEVNRRGFDLTTFTNCISDQQKVIDGLKELKTGLSKRADSKIIAGVDEVLQRAEQWHAEAEVLRKILAGEDDDDAAGE